jgi:hypothetical protein
MITKENLKNQIENLPEKFSIEDLVDRLIFIEKLEKRIEESDENLVITETDLKVEIEKWFK